MAPSISNDDEQQYPEGSGLEDAKTQLDEAVHDAAASAQVLIFQCAHAQDRFTLGEHLSSQANTGHHQQREDQWPVDAYLDLSGHPDKPARCIVRGMVGYWRDLADGLPKALAGTSVLAIDAPEHMLDVMPVRLTRFIQWCVQRRIMVVVLVAETDRVLGLDLRGICVRTDSVLGNAGLHLDRLRDEALAVIAAAAAAAAKDPHQPTGDAT